MRMPSVIVFKLAVALLCMALLTYAYWLLSEIRLATFPKPESFPKAKLVRLVSCPDIVVHIEHYLYIDLDRNIYVFKGKVAPKVTSQRGKAVGVKVDELFLACNPKSFGGFISSEPGKDQIWGFAKTRTRDGWVESHRIMEDKMRTLRSK